MCSSVFQRCILRRRKAVVNRNFLDVSSLFSFSTGASGESGIQTHLTTDYLIERCGLSREKAAIAFSNLTRRKSLKNPDSVLGFLRERGFKDTHIEKLVSRLPRCLSCKIEKNLKPKFAFFEELGLSGSAFADIAVSYPPLIFRHSLKLMTTNIEILQRYGASNAQIRSRLRQEPRFFTQNPDRQKKLTSRVEEIGLKRGSTMFFHATYVLSAMSIASFQAKINLLESFGWSEEDIYSAFRKTPFYLLASEKKIRASMAFFMDELECPLSKVILHPKLLMFSLEKRLVPRYRFLKVLESRGLIKKKVALYRVANMSERVFLKDFVLRYLDDAPDLQQVYHQGRT